jgi:protein subunit release factor A
MKQKLFSITIADCEVQTFTVGGHGGAGKDTSNSGVRVVHPPSGASGESRESRSQLENKRTAFRRMAKSRTFKQWVGIKAAELRTGKTVEMHVEESMAPENLKIEVRDEKGKWVPEKPLDTIL